MKKRWKGIQSMPLFYEGGDGNNFFFFLCEKKNHNLIIKKNPFFSKVSYFIDFFIENLPSCNGYNTFEFIPCFTDVFVTRNSFNHIDYEFDVVILKFFHRKDLLFHH